MIGIIDYNAGNITSVTNLLDRLKIEYFLSSNNEKLSTAKKIIFPGVGHAATAMEELKKRKLDIFLKTTQKPIFAICVGMQVLFDFTEEGNAHCLGIIKGEVKKFSEAQVQIVPHMGWNQIIKNTEKKGFVNINPNADFYFVHSFYCDPKNKDDILYETNYNGKKFCSAIEKNNITAVQFHPEKSGKWGEELLKEFILGS